jgi:APA family basic amino acid/polyamine antiporter
MSRDGLLPGIFSRISEKRQVPKQSTLIVGVLVALFSGLLPLNKLAELTNIGTLFAFMLVSIGVVILRRTNPDLHRAFRVPLVPLVPILAVIFCGYLVFSLPVETKIGFLLWLAVGIVVYFTYGRRHSKLGQAHRLDK